MGITETPHGTLYWQEVRNGLFVHNEDWDKTIAIDLNGMFYCTRLAVPLLKSASGGSIINLSSIAGRLGYPLRAPYSAAKWGVIGFTKSLAMELGSSNIRVNAILPGVVEGERVNRVIGARASAHGIDFEEALQQFVAPISLRRMVSAQDIANMALFLATPAGAKDSSKANSRSAPGSCKSPTRPCSTSTAARCSGAI